MDDLSARVLTRIIEEIHNKQLNQRQLADALGWTPSKLGKVLAGKSTLGVAEMAAICGELMLSVVEAIRDPGMQFMADMTPTELRILDRIRQLDTADKAAGRPGATTDAIMVVLDVRQHTRQQSRRAAPVTKKPRKRAV